MAFGFAAETSTPQKTSGTFLPTGMYYQGRNWRFFSSLKPLTDSLLAGLTADLLRGGPSVT